MSNGRPKTTLGRVQSLHGVIESSKDTGQIRCPNRPVSITSSELNDIQCLKQDISRLEKKFEKDGFLKHFQAPEIPKKRLIGNIVQTNIHEDTETNKKNARQLRVILQSKHTLAAIRAMKQKNKNVAGNQMETSISKPEENNSGVISPAAIENLVKLKERDKDRKIENEEVLNTSNFDAVYEKELKDLQIQQRRFEIAKKALCRHMEELCAGRLHDRTSRQKLYEYVLNIRHVQNSRRRETIIYGNAAFTQT